MHKIKTLLNHELKLLSVVLVYTMKQNIRVNSLYLIPALLLDAFDFWLDLLESGEFRPYKGSV